MVVILICSEGNVNYSQKNVQCILDTQNMRELGFF